MPTAKTLRIPQSAQDLARIVREEIAHYGDKVDLNHIDVSQMSSLEGAFTDLPFNGNISKWDVSRVNSMDGLFMNCSFNGDISNWNTGVLRTANCMFYKSLFNGDISRWNTSNLIVAFSMFQESQFNGDISKWNTSQLSEMLSMFQRSAFNGDISEWNLSHALGMGFMHNIFEGTSYAGNLSSWRTTNYQHIHNGFGPQFKGILPCSANPISKVFYVQLFGTSQRLHQYLQEQAFSGCHFDILRLASSKPEWANKGDYQWAKKMAKIGQSIGMNDDELRTYAMHQYSMGEASATVSSPKKTESFPLDGFLEM